MLWMYIGERTLQFANVFPMECVRRDDPRKIERGDVVEFSTWLTHVWAQIEDPRTVIPGSRPAIGKECDLLSDWMRSPKIVFDRTRDTVEQFKELAERAHNIITTSTLPWTRQPPFVGVKRVVQERLEQLRDAALELGCTDPPNIDSLDEVGAKVALNKLKQWADQELPNGGFVFGVQFAGLRRALHYYIVDALSTGRGLPI